MANPFFISAGRGPGVQGFGSLQRGIQSAAQGGLKLERQKAGQAGLIEQDQLAFEAAQRSAELGQAAQPGLVAQQALDQSAKQDKFELDSVVSGAQQVSVIPTRQGQLDFLKNRQAQIIEREGNPEHTDEGIELLERAVRTGDFTEYDKSIQDILSLGAGSKKGGLASAKTEIFDNGTTVSVLPDGSTQVTNPSGDVVTGTERGSVLKTAREEEIAFAGKKAESTQLGKLSPEASKLEADKQERLAFTKSKSKFEDSITQTVSSIGSAKATNEIMKETVTQIKSFISGLSAVYGASLSGIPGTEAKKLKGLLDTMKANSAFGTLIDLKNSGGTLGAISSTELELLAAKLGSLDQKGDIAEQTRVLDQILAQNQGSLDRMESSFARDKDRFSRGFGEEAPETQNVLTGEQAEDLGRPVQPQDASAPNQQAPADQGFKILGVE